MLNLIIFIEFCKIGLFAIGGGLATLPFLFHLGIVYHWFYTNDLAKLLAIANIVPGPVGINLASLIGFSANGFIGSLMAILGIMTPSLVFVFVISKLLKEFEGNKFVKSIFYMLKPTSCAMIMAICIRLLKNILFLHNQLFDVNQFNWLALLLFIILLIHSFKINRSPIFYFGVSALAGILLHVLKLI